MRSFPRIRKTVKWGGAVLTALLLVVWVASALWGVSWADSWPEGGWERVTLVGIGNGAVTLYTSAAATTPWPASLDFGVNPNPAFYWWFDWTSDVRTFGAAVPIWVLALAALFPTALAWRLDVRARRRERAGKCQKCGYDRAGLPAGAICPECSAAPGTPVPAAK